MGPAHAAMPPDPTRAATAAAIPQKRSRRSSGHLGRQSSATTASGQTAAWNQASSTPMWTTPTFTSRVAWLTEPPHGPASARRTNAARRPRPHPASPTALLPTSSSPFSSASSAPIEPRGQRQASRAARRRSATSLRPGAGNRFAYRAPIGKPISPCLSRMSRVSRHSPTGVPRSPGTATTWVPSGTTSADRVRTQVRTWCRYKPRPMGASAANPAQEITGSMHADIETAPVSS